MRAADGAPERTVPEVPMRPQWWDWHAAVRDHAPTPGALAVAMVWAGVCWNWRRGIEDEARPVPVYLEDLPTHFPYHVGRSTLHRHLAALVEAGLLERVKHGRETVYAPAIPGRQVPVSGHVSGDYVPVSGHVSPDYVPVSSDSGPGIGTRSFSPEVPDPPSHAHTSGRVREDAPTRGANDEIPGNAALVAVLDRLEDRHGAGMAAKVAPGYRQHLIRGLAALEVVGWRSEDLADRLTEGSMRGVGKVGAVLVSRMADLGAELPPETARQRADRRAAAATVTPCDHGTPAGCSGCFMCRRAAPDDDGVICGQCSHHDELTPAGYTPALDFPTESPNPEGTP
jgi:hypothetical protein